MNAFQYHRPASTADAVRALAAGSDARLLAGGQSLLASMKLGLSEPSDLVDLSRVPELQGIQVDGTSVRIGAMTTHAAVAASAEVRRAIPALAALADGYVNDAFSTAHRAHASTEGLAHVLPSAAGLSMQAELEALDRALATPARPAGWGAGAQGRPAPPARHGRECERGGHGWGRGPIPARHGAAAGQEGQAR